MLGRQAVVLAEQVERLKQMLACSVPSPNEYSTMFIRGELLCLNDLCLESFEILVIYAEPYLEGWVGHASLPFEEGDDLFEDFVKCHGVLLA